VVALDGVTVGVPSGIFTAVMVPSGSGKSTLLQCAAGLDLPTEGDWVATELLCRRRCHQPPKHARERVASTM
jgi:ABC-type lipoprotein export system ATPase subunit